jgi:hypothetical protein
VCACMCVCVCEHAAQGSFTFHHPSSARFMISPCFRSPAASGVFGDVMGWDQVSSSLVSCKTISAPELMTTTGSRPKSLIRLNSLPVLGQGLSPTWETPAPLPVLRQTASWEKKYLECTQSRDQYADEEVKPQLSAGALRTLSYNVLHPAGHTSVDHPEYVDWKGYRRERLRRELLSIQASVIALQEVDMVTFDEDFGDFFRARGYDALVFRTKDAEQEVLRRLASKEARGTAADGASAAASLTPLSHTSATTVTAFVAAGGPAMHPSQSEAIEADTPVCVSFAPTVATATAAGAVAAVAADGATDDWKHQLKHMTNALLWRRDELTLEWQDGGKSGVVAAFSMVHLTPVPDSSPVRAAAGSAAAGPKGPKSSRASVVAPPVEVPSKWANKESVGGMDRFEFSPACLASAQPLLWFASVHLKSDGKDPDAGAPLPIQIPPQERVNQITSLLNTIDSAQQRFLQAKRNYNPLAAPSLMHRLDRAPTFFLGNKPDECHRRALI